MCMLYRYALSLDHLRSSSASPAGPPVIQTTGSTSVVKLPLLKPVTQTPCCQTSMVLADAHQQTEINPHGTRALQA